MDREKISISRRGLISGVLGLGAASILSACSGEASPGANSQKDKHSTPAAKEALDIDEIILPDLYEDRPWANPEQLVGLTAEELRDIASIHITEETLSNEGFAVAFGQKLELIANAGRTLSDVSRARELGFPVGERGKYGELLGDYGEYVKEYYMAPMLEGLFSHPLQDTEFAGVDFSVMEYLGGYADNYDLALTNNDWRDKATVLVEAASIETGSQPQFERNISIGLTIGRPVDNGDWRDEAHSGKIIVNASEGLDGKYDLAVQYISVE